MPNTLHHTERPRLLGGVCTSGCMRDFKRISAVLVRRRDNEKHGHGYGHQVTEALSLRLALSLARDARWRFGHAITPHPLLSEERRTKYELVHSPSGIIASTGFGFRESLRVVCVKARWVPATSQNEPR